MAIFSEHLYESKTFKDIELVGGEVGGTEFVDCVFKRCVFTETAFNGCNFRGCSFDDCDLSLIKVADSVFVDVQFENSKIIGVNWTRARWGQGKWQLPGQLSFKGCVLNYSGFVGLRLPEIRVERCTVREVDFSDAILVKANFRGSDLEKSIFRNTDLREADLAGAKGYHIQPALNKIKGAKFSLPEAISLLHGLEVELVSEFE